MSAVSTGGAVIESVEVAAYTVPTDAPESDATLAWDSTTIVVVHATAGGQRGLGWTYGNVATGTLVESLLAGAVCGRDAMDVPAAWVAMEQALRNAGRAGVGTMAMAAVDVALWDLKARLLELPLCVLLGPFHASVPIYGSGGFTSYPLDRLTEQLGGWVAEGIGAVKMKVGRDPAGDPARVAAARAAIGDDAELMVDANGAWTRKQALAEAQCLAAWDVRWLEEPVSSDDLEGLRLIRDRAPAGMAVAAGEYGWDLFGFRALLEAGAVDVPQANVTRCGGITDFVRVGALCKAHEVALSGHCAPSLHAHACCAIEPLARLEYFHDHARLERMLFDGVLEPVGGALIPDRSRPGLGLELKQAQAQRFAV
ncbi:MAG: enolase C-terminal domain-like protein [Thermoleophilaceae bacterium]